MGVDVGTVNKQSGLWLIGLIAGLIAGAGVYGIGEFWIENDDGAVLPWVTLLFTATTAAAFLLLADGGKITRSAFIAVVIAAILAAPDYFLIAEIEHQESGFSVFPVVFWFFVARHLTAYLMIVLAKTSGEDNGGMRYANVFANGITLPLILAGAKLFAGLALILLFAWAKLLEAMKVDFFTELFQEPAFILPFLGAIGGLSIGMMHGQRSVLGALRYVLLLFARIAMPITAVFTITFLIVLAVNGVETIFARPYPAGIMIGLSFVGMLIFNGVYQNGEAAAPPLWLRLASIVTLAGFPVYAGIAFWAFLLRFNAYGLTPPRIIGLAFAGLAAAYSIVCIIGVLSELNWRAKRWMAPVGSLNTAMAGLWVVVSLVLFSPLANPWAISAKSQVERLTEGRADAERFDYGYLQHKLGTYGDKALEELLTLTNHPEYGAIRSGVLAAKGSDSYYQYKYLGTPAPEAVDPAPSEPDNR